MPWPRSQFIYPVNSDGIKECSKCHHNKNASEFGTKVYKEGINLRPTCKLCERERATNWFKKYRDKVMIRRRKDFLKRVGMTSQSYESILKSQGGVCAICTKLPEQNKMLCIDHDHVTGKFRGLLCSSCNTGLGFLGDVLIRLQQAVKYLEKFESK